MLFTFKSSWGRAAGALALVAALSACGGGGEPMSAADATAAQMKRITAPSVDASLCAAGAEGYTELDGQCLASSNALGTITPIKRTTATATITSDQLFAWAQLTFPTLFPSVGASAVVSGAGFVYKVYSTGNALGVTSTLAGFPAGTVLVLGPLTGNQLLSVGTLSSLNCTVAPGNCTPTNPGTGGGGGNYADCLSTELLKTGNTYQIDLKASSPGGSLSTTNKYTVNAQTTFKGNTATELYIDTTVTASTLPANVVGTTTRVKNYTALTGSTYSTYGQIISATVSGFTYDAVTSFTPPIQTPTSLASGGTYTVTSTMKIESSGLPFPIPAQEFSYAYNFKFVGKESVTVPAGTFNACKVVTGTTSNGTTSTNTQWLVAEGRLKGMPLKTDDGAGTISEATKLLLNGS